MIENSCLKEITEPEFDKETGKKLTKKEILMKDSSAETRRKEEECRSLLPTELSMKAIFQMI